MAADERAPALVTLSQLNEVVADYTAQLMPALPQLSASNTGLAVLAFLEWSGDPNKALITVLVEDLVGKQLSHGSWNEELWATGMALLAMARYKRVGGLWTGTLQESVQRACTWIDASWREKYRNWFGEWLETILLSWALAELDYRRDRVCAALANLADRQKDGGLLDVYDTALAACAFGAYCGRYSDSEFVEPGRRAIEWLSKQDLIEEQPWNKGLALLATAIHDRHFDDATELAAKLVWDICDKTSLDERAMAIWGLAAWSKRTAKQEGVAILDLDEVYGSPDRADWLYKKWQEQFDPFFAGEKHDLYEGTPGPAESPGVPTTTANRRFRARSDADQIRAKVQTAIGELAKHLRWDSALTEQLTSRLLAEDDSGVIPLFCCAKAWSQESTIWLPFLRIACPGIGSESNAAFDLDSWYRLRADIQLEKHNGGFILACFSELARILREPHDESTVEQAYWGWDGLEARYHIEFENVGPKGKKMAKKVAGAIARMDYPGGHNMRKTVHRLQELGKESGVRVHSSACGGGFCVLICLPAGPMQ